MGVRLVLFAVVLWAGSAGVVAARDWELPAQWREGLQVTVTQKGERVGERIRQAREEGESRVRVMIKDERKQKWLERFEGRLCETQAKRAAVMEGQVEKIERVLDKLVKRQEVGKKRGREAAVLDAAIAKARAAVSEAKAAVIALRAAGCGISVSGDEKKLRGEAAAAVAELETRVRSAREKVRSSRMAVGEAVRTWAKLRGEEVPARLAE